MEMNTNKCETCGCADGTCASCASGDHHHGMMGGSWHRGYVRIAIIAALGAVALWALVSAVSGVKSFQYIGSGINPTNTISVNGSGKIFAVPDTATFSFTIMETGKDVATAQKAVVTKMNDITAYLKSVNIADRDIQTTSYDANPKYDQTPCVYGSPCPTSNKIIGYTVSETVTVKVRETDKAGDVLSNVGGRGVSNVSGLSFTVDDQELLQQNARDKAIADARGKAEVLARSLGVNLVRIVGFYDNSGGPIMYASKTASMDAGMGGIAPEPANIQIGENTITSSVNVIYEIR